MRKTLAVVFGSRTCEHDVSIISGLQAVSAANKEKYRVVPLYISRAGDWYVGDKLREIAFYANFDPTAVTKVLPVGEDGKLVLLKYPTDKKAFFQAQRTVVDTVDAVLPVMHGMNGEDGTLQGMLEMWNVPYASSGVLGSAVGMDKIAMKLLFKGCGFPTLESTWIDRARWALDREGALNDIERALPYPMYVKPANLGSSIGINRADDRAGLARALDVAIAYDRRILIERGVEKLREVNCSVLGYGGYAKPSVLEMPTRWDQFLTFDEKYLRSGKGGGGKGHGGMESLSRQIPAPIGEELTEKIQALAVDAFQALDCKGVVRIDFLLDGADDRYYIGEINTIPGSLAFYLWEPVGVKFDALIDEMVDAAMRAAAEKNANVFSYDSEILKKQRERGKLRGK